MAKPKLTVKAVIHNFICGTLGLTLILSQSSAGAAPDEIPRATYTGIADASVVLKNIDYTDLRNINPWSEEAIYETGALDIMKGYGDRSFKRLQTISKEQAIAIAYRLAGREAEAQKQAEALDNARTPEEKKKNALNMWSDGYLRLAANEGLITQQDFSDATAEDPSVLTETSFSRQAPAQRQEMAFWIAKALKLVPEYGQQKIFNSYNDWKKADPLKVPYIETVLQNNIMNGDSKGFFSPLASITREQAAQVIKNAEKTVLPLFNLSAARGTIENMDNSIDMTGPQEVSVDTFKVRSSDGNLDEIVVQYPTDGVLKNTNELTGKSISGENGLVVYKNGAIGGSSLLDVGDRLEYITSKDNKVRFIHVLSAANDTKYIAARISRVDPQNLLVNAIEVMPLDSPDSSLIKDKSIFDKADRLTDAQYRLKNGADIVINGNNQDLGTLNPGTDVIITVSGNVITRIESIKFPENQEEEKGVTGGIVEENNPQLGYITLYGPDGSGTGADSQSRTVLRTYNYSSSGLTDVLKNGKKASIDDIEAGDSVFLKLSDGGNPVSVSAKDNYVAKYAKVLSKKPSSMLVQYDDGTQQVLDSDKDTPVVLDKNLVGYSALKDGDRVKVILHIANQFTKLKEITIEGSEHFIDEVYKAKVAGIDDVTGSMTLLNLESFNKGKWQRTDQKGFNTLKLSDGYSIYNGDSKVDPPFVNKNLKYNEAYIAVQKPYGKDREAVLVAFRDNGNTEVLIDDTVSDSQSGSGQFAMSKTDGAIKYTKGSIIIKDDRLVSGGSVVRDDLAYVAANRDIANNEYSAGVIQINDRFNLDFVQVYRGRIKEITGNNSFTLESFSQLKGLSWEYTNTPKTFKINFDTRVLDDAGVVNQRDFVGYGTGSYVGKSVYIIADDINAKVVSTAGYGVKNSKGEIYELTGQTLGEEGDVVQPPTGFKLWQGKNYDTTNHIWADAGDLTINILKNSMILKNNRIAGPEDLEKGDKVRIIRKDDTASGDAYIIIVEE